MNNMELGIEIFKYPKKDGVLRKVMKEFVQDYVVECDGVGQFGVESDGGEEKSGNLRE